MHKDRPLDLNVRKNRQFQTVYLQVLKNIKLNKIVYVKYITFIDKYDELYYIVIEPIDLKETHF